jgi:hypothetical protein
MASADSSYIAPKGAWNILRQLRQQPNRIHTTHNGSETKPVVAAYVHNKPAKKNGTATSGF